VIAENEKKTWFLVQTNSRCEKKCLEGLTKMHVEAFLPLQKVKRQWSDRIKTIEEPLFKGYIFVKIEPKNRFSIFKIPNIFRYVQFNGEYATISQKEINAIKKTLEKGESIEIVDIDFEIGQEVLVTSGPFTGIHARLIDTSKKGKLILEVKAIGKGVVMELGSSKVRIICENPKIA
jgi:transcription antitermination factor NusG